MYPPALLWYIGGNIQNSFRYLRRLGGMIKYNPRLIEQQQLTPVLNRACETNDTRMLADIIRPAACENNPQGRAFKKRQRRRKRRDVLRKHSNIERFKRYRVNTTRGNGK